MTLLNYTLEISQLLHKKYLNYTNQFYLKVFETSGQNVEKTTPLFSIFWFPKVI